LLFVLSTKVIARLNAVIFPAKIPSINSAEVGWIFLNCLMCSIDAMLILSGCEMPGFSFKALEVFFLFNKTVYLKSKSSENKNSFKKRLSFETVLPVSY
jgi:hypothetical protein